MNYKAYLSLKAAEKVQSLPGGVAFHVANGIRRLEQNPVDLSRKAVFPFPPAGQIYEFDVESTESGEVNSYHIIVFFTYNENETELNISAIGHFLYPSSS
jgi:hypothetical protein